MPPDLVFWNTDNTTNKRRDILRFVSNVVSGHEGLPVRADAQRNRRRLLDAAIEDAVALRAGVGIGTLYRHFPDRQALLRTVVVDVLDRTIEQGHLALAESTNGTDALRRYMHATIDTGLGVVNIVHALVDDHDWPDQRADAQHMLSRLIDNAQRDGAISALVTAIDIALATIRFCRPLTIGLPATEEAAIAHQQLDIYLDGLMTPTKSTKPTKPARKGQTDDRTI
jgi:AcrR family transcriptional regulator